MLCDISGSMEPYARAMLQLLYCAAGAPRAEVFVFATQLTRLTPVLAHSLPGPALAEAGQARRTGPAAPASVPRSASSSTATAAGAWRAARSC